MKGQIYIVTAYRWGDNSNHSYNLGVFTNRNRAEIVADEHCKYRGGKYACVVERCINGRFDNDADNYTTEVYRAKSLQD